MKRYRPTHGWLRRWFFASKLIVWVRPSGRATVRKDGCVVYVGTLRYFNRIIQLRQSAGQDGGRKEKGMMKLFQQSTHLLITCCAWCGKWISTEVLSGPGDDIFSHAPCPVCDEKVREDLKR